MIPIANVIQSSGYQSAFLWFGLGQGFVVILVAMLMRAPNAGEVPAPATPAVQQTRRDYGPAEVLKTPPFWVMYAMFVMVGAGGLMAVAQLALDLHGFTQLLCNCPRQVHLSVVGGHER